jgi:hypothetical protein
MTTPTNADFAGSAASSPITKIGTEVFGLRVITGYLHAADPGQILLRQLYPDRPTNIGRIEAIGSGTGRLVINPDRETEWTDSDRALLAAFFLTRYTDRIVNQPCIDIRAESRTDMSGGQDDRAV